MRPVHFTMAVQHVIVVLSCYICRLHHQLADKLGEMGGIVKGDSGDELSLAVQ